MKAGTSVIVGSGSWRRAPRSQSCGWATVRRRPRRRAPAPQREPRDRCRSGRHRRSPRCAAGRPRRGWRRGRPPTSARPARRVRGRHCRGAGAAFPLAPRCIRPFLAAVGHQAVEADLLTDVVGAGPARCAVPATVDRLDGDPVTRGVVRDAGADLGDRSREFVPHGERKLPSGQRMRFGRHEDRTGIVFVQVSTADPVEAHLDLDGAGCRSQAPERRRLRPCSVRSTQLLS